MTEHSPIAGTDARSPAFFVQPRPIWHYVVLTLGTFGVYLVFWFWRVWRYFRVVRNRPVMPLARALFNLLFIYSLLRHLRDEARLHGYPEQPPAGPLAVLYVVLSVCGLLPPPAAFAQTLNLFPLLPAFEMANYIWRAAWPGIPEKRGFSLPEALVLGFGFSMWAYLIYLGIFHPEMLTEAMQPR